MKRIVATLLLLATPLSAQASEGWREPRGVAAEPHGLYAAPPQRPYAGPPGPQAGPRGGPPPRTQQERARQAVRAGQRVPLPVVIDRLRHQTGAEYVDAREVTDAYGRPLYLLRFRQRGRYFDVPVDAETGQVQR